MSASFREYVRRVATGSRRLVPVWRDVLLSNREEILKQSMRFRHTLDALEHVMKSGNAEALEGLIRAAAESRAAWQMNSKPGSKT